MKYIACQGCSLVCSPSGTAEILNQPSSHVLVDDKGLYSGTLTIKVSNSMAGGINTPPYGTGTGTLTPSSTKTLIDNKPAVLYQDSCTVMVTGTITTTTGATEVTVPVTVKIVNPNQLYVKGE